MSELLQRVGLPILPSRGEPGEGSGHVRCGGEGEAGEGGVRASEQSTRDGGPAERVPAVRGHPVGFFSECSVFSMDVRECWFRAIVVYAAEAADAIADIASAVGGCGSGQRREAMAASRLLDRLSVCLVSGVGVGAQGEAVLG